MLLITCRGTMRNRTQPCSNMKNVLSCRWFLLGEICLKTNYLLSVVDKCIYSVLFQPLYQVTIDQMLLFFYCPSWPSLLFPLLLLLPVTKAKTMTNDLFFSDQRAKDVDTGFCFLRIHQVCGLFHCYHVSQKVCGRLVVRKRCDPSLTCSWLQISRAQSLQGVSSYMPESLKVFKVFDLQVYLSYFKRNLALLYTDSKPFSGAVYSF